jgi:predicted porin
MKINILQTARNTTLAVPASLCLLCLAASSHAQSTSSVSVYGILDLSLVSLNNPVAQGNRTLLHSGSLQTSRLGFRGTEDLGGGLTANFDMLSGPTPDNGLVGGGAKFFNLGTSVGLAHREYGSIDAGFLRNPNIFVAFATDLSGYGLANYSITSNLQHQSIMTNGVGGFYENTIRYRTPNFSGLRAELTHSLGDETAVTGRKNNEFDAMNVQYTSGPMYVGFGYSNFATRTATRNDNAKATIIGGTYDFKWVKLGAHTVRTERPTVTQRSNQVSAKFKPTDGKLELDVGIGRLTESTRAAPSTSAVSVGATYHVSKRTDFYTFATKVSNNATGTRGMFFYGNGTIAAGGTSRAVGLGLRHAF